MFAFPPDIAKKLEEFRLAASFTALSNTPRDKEGNPTQELDPEKACRCRLTDTLTGKLKLFADGPDERTALDRVINMLTDGHKALTPAEIAEENRRLRAELNALKAKSPVEPGQGDEDGEGEGSVIKSHSTTTEPDTSASAEAPSAYDQLNPNELAQALRSRNLPVPQGDRDSGEWRDKATERLEAHDAAAS